jgi:hypothetical protein
MKTKYMNMTISTFLFLVSPIENLKNHFFFKTLDWFFNKKFPIKKVVHDTQLYMHENGCLYLTIFTFQTKHKEPFEPRIQSLLIIQYFKEYSQNLDLKF